MQIITKYNDKCHFNGADLCLRDDAPGTHIGFSSSDKFTVFVRDRLFSNLKSYNENDQNELQHLNIFNQLGRVNFSPELIAARNNFVNKSFVKVSNWHGFMIDALFDL